MTTHACGVAKNVFWFILFCLAHSLFLVVSKLAAELLELLAQRHHPPLLLFVHCEPLFIVVEPHTLRRVREGCEKNNAGMHNV
jgi:hypothetical protein